MKEAPVRAGDVLGQKYRVDKVLGVGGMGVVVAATHLHLDQRVALKFMLASAFENPESLARFQSEARAAVRLQSEHVARVLDTGSFENQSPYIVMEFLEGHDLSAELERRGRCPSRWRPNTSSRSATRWPRRTRSASSIAISSRRTSS
jgi:serine/threonine-protein kinase